MTVTETILPQSTVRPVSWRNDAALGLAGALLFAYVLQGLAVIHVYSRGASFRAVLLAAVYLGILLLGWVALVVAILGLAEPLLGLRQRGQPPGSGGTS